MQYFCGYTGYDDSKPPFEASSMVNFRKRLTPEIIAEINEMIIQKAYEDSKNDDDNSDNSSDNSDSGDNDHSSEENDCKNSGTMIVDATCAPQNIKYPQDVELLNEAREKLEKLIDKVSDENGKIEIRYGACESQAGKYCRSCCCNVNFAAEPA